MLYCSNCGKKISNDINFCPFCGTENIAKQKKNEDETVINKNVNIKEEIKLTEDCCEEDDFNTIVHSQKNYGFKVTELPSDFILDNRYRILKKIGQGGFGAVYKAYDKHLRTKKAVKIISSQFYKDKNILDSLSKEAQLLYRINHPNVVRFFDIHLSGSIKYIDMEFISGENLSEMQRKYPDKRVPENEIVLIAVQIAEALKEAHSKSILHKDIKPQNIMITNTKQIKIMDFGISEVLRSKSSSASLDYFAGTPPYVAPESHMGKSIGKQSDIWSYGVLLYQLLFGELPFKGKSSDEILHEILNRKDIESFLTNSKNGKIAEIISYCLRVDLNERIRSFSEILKILKRGNETNKNNSVNVSDNRFLEKDFIFIKSGKFMMGDNLGIGDSDELPCHDVELNSFVISKYPVLFKEFDSYCKSVNIKTPDDEGWGRENRPVINISWYEAVEFCNWKSRQSGCSACYNINKKIHDPKNLNKYDELKWSIKCDFNANGYRLPTEAEWEFAAKGRISDNTSRKNNPEIDLIAWFKDNSENRTHPAGLKNPNIIGLYDIIGNVWEWCWDWYEENYYSKSERINPRGPDRGQFRVMRGGCWNRRMERVRVTDRLSSDPSYVSNVIGFRLVRSI